MVRKPIRPTVRGGPAPLVPGRFKQEPADFAVEELPSYEPCGAGTHTFVWIEKEGISTHDAIFELARALGRREREFGFAGLKDAQAITRQWLSIEHCDERALKELELPRVRVLDVRRHGNKLKAGHLRGNRFTILLRGLAAEHVEPLRSNLLHLAARGAPNWFGEQRFGKRGANLEKGLQLLADPRGAHRRVPQHLFKLVLSAVQSEAFNRVLTRRIASIDEVWPGDVAFLHANGACFVVENAAQEQPRCAGFEISPSGPLPGERCLRPSGAQAEIEAAALAELGIEHASFAKLPRDTHPGARRPLRVPVGNVMVEVAEGGVRVGFELPAGAYATAVLREVVEDAPWFGEGGEAR